MTRKRFKKLLMSYGYSRNEAECKSLCARSFYESYNAANEAYARLHVHYKVLFDCTDALLAVGKALISMKDEFANIVNSIAYNMQPRKDDANE